MGSFFAWTAEQITSVISGFTEGAIADLYALITYLANIINEVREAIQWFLQELLNWIWEILQIIGHFLMDVIHWLLHTLLPDLIRWINEIRAKITAWLQPLIQWLKYEKALLDSFYNNVLKPILNLIQRLRSILMIFRLLHIGWAEKLDQYLANMENEISQKFLEVVQGLQMVTNWVNWLTDPTGLFNLPLLLLSNIETLPQLWAALWDQQSVPIGGVDQQAQQAAAQSGTYGNAKSDITGRGSFPTSDDLSRYNQVYGLYQADGYPQG